MPWRGVGALPFDTNGATQKITNKTRRAPLRDVTVAQDGRFQVVWVDTRPDEPLHGDSVMRWDSRPDDWWRYWPELLQHPCAFQFARTHPVRNGLPSVEDWVATFPAGFDWRSRLHEDWQSKMETVLAHWEKNPESKLPTLPALIPEGALYAVDSSGRPRRFGTVLAGKVTVAEPEKLRRIARSAAECTEDLAALLSGVDDTRRARLAELLATLVQAPDSERTKAGIRELLMPNVVAQTSE